MSRFAFLTAVLLLLVRGAAWSAEPAAEPEPFAAPPHLAEKAAIGARLLAAPVPSIGCRPEGDVTRDGNLVTLHLVAKVAPNRIHSPVEGPGAQDNVQLRSYGGCLTGPMIEAKPGNTLRVFLKNDLSVNDPSCPPGGHAGPGCFNTLNLHYHGLHVSPTGNSDNVLLNIGPQTQFEYEVNIPVDHPSGTFWYHPHRHGSTALQVASGASGALIIRGDRRYTGGAPGDIDTILHDAAGKPIPEQIFLFQQIPYACFDDKGNIITYPDGLSWKCPKDKIGVVENFDSQLSSATVWDTSGRFTSINGAVQPTLTGVPAGQVQRWRFIHGGIHDTVNLQIVPMVNAGPKSALAMRGIMTGSAKEQEETLKQICPVTVPDGSHTVALVPQFEVASDGLTHTAITPIGVGEKSVSGGIGSNFLQPGYRSDVLVAFPHAGTYCILNQAATPAERAGAGNGPGGQGPNETQLLATVIVSGGTPVVGDIGDYVRHTLYEGNKNDRTLPKTALDGLLKGDLTPWRGMPEEGPASNSANPRSVAFFIGNLPDKPGNPFGFWLNQQEYDPNRVDATLQVGATEDWVLTSQGEPHIYHIHVNPFEIMDVTYHGKSIFGAHGECLVPPDSVGLQNQYCHLWHTFKDTVFVQNDYEVHVRSTYDRYIGEFVMHCHILDHEDSGMMANVLIVPDVAAPGGGLGMAEMGAQSNGTMVMTHHKP